MFMYDIVEAKSSFNYWMINVKGLHPDKLDREEYQSFHNEWYQFSQT